MAKNILYAVVALVVLAAILWGFHLVHPSIEAAIQ